MTRIPRWLGPAAAVVLLVSAPAAGWMVGEGTPTGERPVAEVEAVVPVVETVQPSTTVTTVTSAAAPAADHDEPARVDEPAVTSPAGDSSSGPAEQLEVAVDPEPGPTTTVARPTTTAPPPATTTTTVAAPDEGWCMGADDVIVGSPPGQKCIPGDGSAPSWGPGSCPPEERTDQGCA